MYVLAGIAGFVVGMAVCWFLFVWDPPWDDDHSDDSIYGYGEG